MSARTNKTGLKYHMAIQRQTVILVLIFVVALGLVGLSGWYLSRPSTKNLSTVSHSMKSSMTTTPAAPNSAKGKQYSSTSSSDPSPSTTASSATEESTSSGSLPAPSGQLLNVQTLSLSSEQSLESVCQTIANATCDIRLTSGNTVKYIGSRSTGINGLVIFDWSAKMAGLTTGQWSVRAVVTQNGAVGISHTEYLTVQQ
jgi:hypothetical protein